LSHDEGIMIAIINDIIHMEELEILIKTVDTCERSC